MGPVYRSHIYNLSVTWVSSGRHGVAVYRLLYSHGAVSQRKYAAEGHAVFTTRLLAHLTPLFSHSIILFLFAFVMFCLLL